MAHGDCSGQSRYSGMKYLVGLLVSLASAGSALAWQPGDPFPKAQCGPQAATLGPDVTVCRAIDQDGNKHLGVYWPHDTPESYAIGPCDKKSKLPTKRTMDARAARMYVEFYCNWIDWN